jgi:phenylacetate-CoA ligase
MKRNKIFERMPLFLREWMLNRYAKSLNRERFSDCYRDTLQFLRKSQWWNSEEFQFYQLSRLRELAVEVCEYVPFYRSLHSPSEMEDIGRKAQTPQELLSVFPVIEKSMLRENIDNLTSTDPKLKTVSYATTSGTTGMPLRVPSDQFAPQISQAFLRRFYDWMDLPDQFRSIRFSGNVIVPRETTHPPFWLENKERSQLFMSTYHISDSTIPHYLEKIQSYQPLLIDGYPSAIGFIAKYILQNNLRMGFHPKAIATTAETLDDHTRREIEEAFGCKVFNQYASSEGAPLITECAHGTLHENPESGILEYVNMQGVHAGPGEIGKMIVTSFRNMKVPLIRYRIGDTVLLPEGKKSCLCGRQMSSVEKITGRIDDILFTVDGYAVGIACGRLFANAKNIRKGQVVQRGVDEYQIKIVKGSDFSANDEKSIFDRAKLTFGKEARIIFEYLDEIPFSANGKYKRSINEYAKQSS